MNCAGINCGVLLKFYFGGRNSNCECAFLFSNLISIHTHCGARTYTHNSCDLILFDLSFCCSLLCRASYDRVDLGLHFSHTIEVRRSRFT